MSRPFVRVTSLAPYANREEAGRVLAGHMLPQYAGRENLIILALPRGGVPVAFEVAHSLSAPLDLMLVRKLGAPGQEELAMGAIATGGAQVLNHHLIQQLGVTAEMVQRVIEREQRELSRRERAYRGDRPAPSVQGRCVVLIDDGLATGASMDAAIAAVRQLQPAGVVVAVPVAPYDTILALQQRVDDVICPSIPSPFGGVSRWYIDFAQTTDEQVRDMLERAGQR